MKGSILQQRLVEHIQYPLIHFDTWATSTFLLFESSLVVSLNNCGYEFTLQANMGAHTQELASNLRPTPNHYLVSRTRSTTRCHPRPCLQQELLLVIKTLGCLISP